MTVAAPDTASVPAVPAPASKAGPGTYVGWGGAIALLGVLDQFLKDHGEIAATTLTKLGPISGPVWGNWPILVLIGFLGYQAYQRWREGQAVRAAESAAAAKASAELAAEVRDVASGLGAVRTEVHQVASGLNDLRTDLRAHAEQTAVRFREADTSLREFVRAEIVPIRERVAVLESRGTRKPQ